LEPKAESSKLEGERKEGTMKRRVFLSIVMVMALAGCTIKHAADIKEGVTIQPNTKIEVGKVTNRTGESFDIDIEKMFAEAMTEVLQKKELLWSEGNPKLIIDTNIVEYQKGNAFKRWLMPGWGKTILAIRADLKRENTVIGSAEAKRTVTWGGGFTIGAWKTIFRNLSEDVVEDLQDHLK